MDHTPENIVPRVVFNGRSYMLPLAAEWNDITPADRMIIQQRVEQFHARYPDGVPSAKRKAPYRMHIESKDIVTMFNYSLRKAQLILQNTRFALGKKKNDRVTVLEFCKINNFEEAEVRDFLNKMDEMEMDEAESDSGKAE